MTSSATERVRVITPGQTYAGKQGFTYTAGASAETVGAERVCMNLLPMPRRHADKRTLSQGYRYLLSGECMVYSGESLERRVLVHVGDQIFIPANGPHAPCNESDSPCTWIVVHLQVAIRTGIVLLPELDARLAAEPSRLVV